MQPELIQEVPAAPAADYADEVPAAPSEIPVEMPEVSEPLEQEPDVVAPEVMTPGLDDHEAMPAAVNESVEEKATTASRITHVTVGGEQLEVTANGPIDNVDSFTLEDPDRLVIDFWGAKSSVWPDHLAEARPIPAPAAVTRTVLPSNRPIRASLIWPKPSARQTDMPVPFATWQR